MGERGGGEGEVTTCFFLGEREQREEKGREERG